MVSERKGISKSFGLERETLQPKKKKKDVEVVMGGGGRRSEREIISKREREMGA